MQWEFSPVVEKLLSEKCNRDIIIAASTKVAVDKTSTPASYISQYKAASEDSIDINIRSLLSVGINASEPVTTSPILEILQARHDVLYARLFNS